MLTRKHADVARQSSLRPCGEKMIVEQRKKLKTFLTKAIGQEIFGENEFERQKRLTPPGEVARGSNIYFQYSATLPTT